MQTSVVRSCIDYILPIICGVISHCLLEYQSHGTNLQLTVLQKLVLNTSKYSSKWISMTCDVLPPLSETFSTDNVEEKCVALSNQIVALIKDDMRSLDDIELLMDCYISILYTGILSDDKVLHILTEIAKVYNVTYIKNNYIYSLQNNEQLLPLIILKVSINM